MAIYSDGYNHPFAETSAELAWIAAAEGFTAEVTGDLTVALRSSAEGANVLAVNALRWSMTQHERYAADRETWAGALADHEISAIERFVDQGGALLALHTAIICWDTQPRWTKLLGGGWTWDHSFHPPYGAVNVRLTAAGSRMSEGPAGFSLRDEAYHRLDPQPDCEILATAEAGQGDQPVAWRRTVGMGRVAVDALGHDAASLQAGGHASLLRGIMRWLGEAGA